MKRIKVELTIEQARAVAYAVAMDQNDDYPDSDPDNRFLQRIVDKFENAIKAAEEEE